MGRVSMVVGPWPAGSILTADRLEALLQRIGVRIVERVHSALNELWYLEGAALGEPMAHDVSVAAVMVCEALADGRQARDEAVEVEIEGRRAEVWIKEFHGVCEGGSHGAG